MTPSVGGVIFLYVIFFHCIKAEAGKSATENCTAVDVDVVAAAIYGR